MVTKGTNLHVRDGQAVLTDGCKRSGLNTDASSPDALKERTKERTTRIKNNENKYYIVAPPPRTWAASTNK